MTHSPATLGAAAAVAVLGAAVLAGCGSAPGPAAVDLASAAPQTFSFTGAPVVVTVPAGATSVVIDAIGGSGGVGQGEDQNNQTTCSVGQGAKAGGNGAKVTAIARVSAGQAITVAVGGAGGTAGCGNTTSFGAWGGHRAGGGAGPSGNAIASGGGGGASTVDVAGTTIWAGGGGGGGSKGIEDAGAGGAGSQAGDNGQPGRGPDAGNGGAGGDQPGPGGTDGGRGSADGGDGGAGGGGIGGGGGASGGQFGGGGGGGGGGGRSWADATVLIGTAYGTATAPGNGTVTLTWQY